jgi:hypothetical protein
VIDQFLTAPARWTSQTQVHTFFTRLCLDGRKAAVVEHELREPFDAIFGQGYRRYTSHQELQPP